MLRLYELYIGNITYKYSSYIPKGIPFDAKACLRIDVTWLNIIRSYELWAYFVRRGESVYSLIASLSANKYTW